MTAKSSVASLYGVVGARAFAVAYALSGNALVAEHVVVETFTAIARMSPRAASATGIRGVFTSIVVRCDVLPLRPSLVGNTDAHRKRWASLPIAERIVVALAVFGRCSLDDIAEIMAADRIQVARDMRRALHALV